jgi:hypothetical protein
MNIQQVLNAGKAGTEAPKKGFIRVWFNDGISVGSGLYDIPEDLLREAKEYLWEDEDDPRCVAEFAKDEKGDLLTF